MNVLETLKRDHTQINRLFSRLADASRPEEKQAIFNNIKQKIGILSSLEQNILYPALQKNPRFSSLVEECKKDYQKIMELLGQLTVVTSDGDQFSNRISELIDGMDRHIDVEENELFPEIRRAFLPLELDELGKKLEEKKLSLQTPLAA
jgi:hemerythrin-like domain-containing protein